ncbi:MAG: (d)CMP kinase, partial [Acidobacteria bacterium]|nr:(d)CMP kinase [Acidobacteriota bacterium]
GAVLDGRDIGTVVFPNADVKFYLTAKPEARAQRRFEEDTAKGISTSYEKTLNEINNRDARDKSREDSPLTVAKGSVVIDTSDMDESAVFEKMLKVIGKAQKSKAV